LTRKVSLIVLEAQHIPIGCTAREVDGVLKSDMYVLIDGHRHLVEINPGTVADHCWAEGHQLAEVRHVQRVFIGRRRDLRCIRITTTAGVINLHNVKDLDPDGGENRRNARRVEYGDIKPKVGTVNEFNQTKITAARTVKATQVGIVSILLPPGRPIGNDVDVSKGY